MKKVDDRFVASLGRPIRRTVDVLYYSEATIELDKVGNVPRDFVMRLAEMGLQPSGWNPDTVDPGFDEFYKLWAAGPDAFSTLESRFDHDKDDYLPAALERVLKWPRTGTGGTETAAPGNVSPLSSPASGPVAAPAALTREAKPYTTWKDIATALAVSDERLAKLRKLHPQRCPEVPWFADRAAVVMWFHNLNAPTSLPPDPGVGEEMPFKMGGEGAESVRARTDGSGTKSLRDRRSDSK